MIGFLHGWGIERDKTWGGGGLPTLPSLNLSTFQPSHRGFFRVHTSMCEGRESLSPDFQTFQDPRHQFHKIGRLVLETLYLFAILALLKYPGGTDSLEIFALLKSFKIRALENYVCLLRHISLTPSGLNLCQIVKTVHKTLYTLIFIPNIDSSTEHQ